ncbi:hypothetical protein QJS10_CPB20g00770 [Acorus calamus]|uniref:Uncharacterized protein n=1 Tax=Acorus calamus TaxID=4465 RepID=A0AAV9CCE1_ACOCL|nr:hypothetical protein QJS10_CPB20g00770 [Acorus calamus]
MDASDQRLFCSRSFPSNAYFTTPDGRIALFWDKDLLDIIVIGFSAQHIHCLVQPNSLPRQFPYYYTYVYASNSYSERIALWSTLVSISTAISGSSWCVGGDFNEVRTGSEKVGGRPIHFRRVRKFNNCLLSCSLEDIKSMGHTLSWSNLQENRIACRLDRILANPQFFAEFPHALLPYLPHGPSDNALLKLKARPLIPTEPPFRYFEMWEEHSQFSYVVEAAWKQSFDARSSRNSISCLHVTDGTSCTNPGEIKSSIIQYYKNLLNPEFGCLVPALNLSNVPQNQNATMVDLVTLEEVKQAVFVLVNGSPEGFFSASCRLHQDDPLSPLLFTLVMESFSNQLDKLCAEGEIRPYLKYPLWATWVKTGISEAPEYGTTFPHQAALALGSILLPQGLGLQTRHNILFLKGSPSMFGMILDSMARASRTY